MALSVALLQFFLELPQIMNDPSVSISPFIFVTNALAAFGKHEGRAGGALVCASSIRLAVLQVGSTAGCLLAVCLNT